LRDLERILEIDDIASEQKSEALVMRGRIFADLGRLEDAQADLETVFAADELFPGTRAKALVGLADVAGREQDSARAREYLDMALRCSDIDDNSLIELLIVSGRLSVAEGDTSLPTPYGRTFSQTKTPPLAKRLSRGIKDSKAWL